MQRRLYKNYERDSQSKSCQAHSPSIVVRESGGYLIECLVCGLRGPKRSSFEEAKIAYDEIIKRADTLSDGAS
jgi:hypothetical protein